MRSCGSCRGDLTGKPLTHPCPDCGWRPDIRCIACGYEVSGLPNGGLCPECATPIAESIRGDGLAFASIEHLQRLSKGLVYTRLGVGLMVCVWFLALAMRIAISVITWSPPPRWLMDVIVAGPVVGCLALWSLGWWKVTTPDPRLADTESSRAPLCARWVAVVIAVVATAALLASPWVAGTVPGAGLAVFILLMPQYACGAACLRRLAIQAGNRRAARLARFVQISVGVLAATVLASAVKDAIGYHPPPRAIVPRLFVFLGGLAMLVSAVAMLFQQAGSAGLIRDDLRRFLFHARNHRSPQAIAPRP